MNKIRTPDFTQIRPQRRHLDFFASDEIGQARTMFLAESLPRFWAYYTFDIRLFHR